LGEKKLNSENCCTAVVASISSFLKKKPKIVKTQMNWVPPEKYFLGFLLHQIEKERDRERKRIEFGVV
jgi:hypothetical protein